MSEAESAPRRTISNRIFDWLYRILSRPGWRRKTMLACVAAIFIITLAILWSRVDYRTDPGALVPKSTQFYVETRDLDLLLRNLGSWPLWNDSHRDVEGTTRSRLQIAMVEKLGAIIPDLGTRLPFLWTSGNKNAAALALMDSDVEGETSWALFMHLQDPETTLAETRSEPGIRLERMAGGKDGVYTLTKHGSGNLALAVVGPWLVLSSDGKFPNFAIDAMRRPQHSLAYANVMPRWSRNLSFRGVASPMYVSRLSELHPLLSGFEFWVEPGARLSFTARLDSEGGMESSSHVVILSQDSRGGGVWPFLRFMLYVICIASAIAVVLVLLSIFGWTGWLKAAAIRAGVKPGPKPDPVDPSDAFKEDAGMVKPASDVQPDQAGVAEPSPVRDTQSETEVEPISEPDTGGVEQPIVPESIDAPPEPTPPLPSTASEVDQSDQINENGSSEKTGQ
ncbi:MAG: hypothetical protein LIP23_05515 [Planctomycetes bacterium]|nr:hypothetical protein [Planctomycetota bacterium]